MSKKENGGTPALPITLGVVVVVVIVYVILNRTVFA